MLNNLIAYLTTVFTDVKEGEEGQGLVEYALIISLVSIASILALGLLSGGINGVFTTITGVL